MAIMPALILWYLSTREVKAAFGEGEQPEPIAAPLPSPRREPRAPLPSRGTRRGRRAGRGRDRRHRRLSRRQSLPISTRIADVEGIGPAYAETLAAAGIATTDDLLAAGAKPYDRERIAEATGISSKLHPRVGRQRRSDARPGVGPQYSDLLEAAGVGSPAELAQRNPAHLAITVQEVVAARPGSSVGSQRGRDRGLDRGGGKLDMVVEH